MQGAARLGRSWLSAATLAGMTGRQGAGTGRRPCTLRSRWQAGQPPIGAAPGGSRGTHVGRRSVLVYDLDDEGGGTTTEEEGRPRARARAIGERGRWLEPEGTWSGAKRRRERSGVAAKVRPRGVEGEAELSGRTEGEGPRPERVAGVLARGARKAEGLQRKARRPASGRGLAAESPTPRPCEGAAPNHHRQRCTQRHAQRNTNTHTITHSSTA